MLKRRRMVTGSEDKTKNLINSYYHTVHTFGIEILFTLKTSDKHIQHCNQWLVE